MEAIRSLLHAPALIKEMKKSAQQLAEYYKAWLDKYPFVSIEEYQSS